MGTNVVPATRYIDDQGDIDVGGSRPQYSGPSADSMEGDDPDSGSDDDDDAAECENLITELTNRLQLPSRVVAEVSQFATVSARIVDTNIF